jgi:ketosteroid isomerase-like protein
MPERNKAVARAVFEVWSTGDIDRLDERLTAARRVGKQRSSTERSLRG